MVDASALVAILLEEPDSQRLSHLLDQAQYRVTHAISIYETVTAVRRVKQRDIASVAESVSVFLAKSRFDTVSIGPAEAVAALDAFRRYGRGRHPAGLNMGDCFSCAVARMRGLPLLYKGDDFALTDLA